MNKALIAERFSKAIGTYAQKADIQQQIAEKMTCLLQQHLPATPFNKVVEFGCGTGNYSRLLYHTLQPKQFFLNDLCNGMQACCHDLLDQGAIFLTGDAETLDFPEDTELLTSCSTLQWFESPENFFHRCHHRLSRNGYLAITTFGQENMKEIRSVTGQGLLTARFWNSKQHSPLLRPHSFGRGETASFFSLPPASALPSERDRSDGNRKTALDPARTKPFL